MLNYFGHNISMPGPGPASKIKRFTQFAGGGGGRADQKMDCTAIRNILKISFSKPPPTPDITKLVRDFLRIFFVLKSLELDYFTSNGAVCVKIQVDVVVVVVGPVVDDVSIVYFLGFVGCDWSIYWTLAIRQQG